MSTRCDMARIRSIKPEAFHSESLSQCSVEAERTFWGMSTIADDKGRLKDQPAVINGALWCLRPQHTAEAVDDEIGQLVAAGVLCRYSVDGKGVIHFPTWDDHQKINRPGKSRLPYCPRHDPGPDSDGTHGDVTASSVISHGDVSDGSRTDLGSRNRDQGTGIDACDGKSSPDAPIPLNGRRRETIAQQNARTLATHKPDPTRWGTIG